MSYPRTVSIRKCQRKAEWEFTVALYHLHVYTCVDDVDDDVEVDDAEDYVDDVSSSFKM